MKKVMNLRFAGKLVALAALFALGAVALPRAHAQAAGHKTFSSPDEAVVTFIRAVRDGNTPDLLAILGPGSEELVSSGDSVADKAARERFLAAYDLKHSLSGEGSRQLSLNIGKDGDPFPVPLAHDGGKWYWDGAAGMQEFLRRRVKSNELAAMEVCKRAVAAQRDYAKIGHDNLPARTYAQQLMSDPGKRNGLYWQASEWQLELHSPAGPMLAQARAEGYAPGKGLPYHGYRFSILTAQGANAKGGAHSYIAGGLMTRGFAFLAYPAGYRSTGVMTFIVSDDGTVYQKDLGERTAEIARQMTEYNPDSTWTAVK